MTRMRTAAVSLPVAILIGIVGISAVGGADPRLGVPTLGGPGLPPDKHARLDAQASAQASAQAASRPKVAPVTIPEQTDPPPDYSGSTPAGNGHLFVTSYHPMGEADETVTTEWDEMLADGKLTVWAGAFTGDATQGFVEYARFNSQGELVAKATVDLPAGSGPATIIGATGDVLLVADTHGDSFSYAPLGQGLQKSG